MSSCRDFASSSTSSSGPGDLKTKGPESSLPGAWQANLSWRITVHTMFIFETITVSHIRLWDKQISGSLVEGQWSPTFSICFLVARCYFQMTDTWTHHVPRLFRKERAMPSTAMDQMSNRRSTITHQCLKQLCWKLKGYERKFYKSILVWSQWAKKIHTIWRRFSNNRRENNKNSNIMGLIILPSAATLRELIRWS